MTVLTNVWGKAPFLVGLSPILEVGFHYDCSRRWESPYKPVREPTALCLERTLAALSAKALDSKIGVKPG